MHCSRIGLLRVFIKSRSLKWS